MKNIKTAFITFFPIFPDTMGSSTVINSRFKSWPFRKKIFQISHLRKINNNKIETTWINKESPIKKILKLPEHIYRINRYLKNSKKKIIIIEGASWIFYSFVILFFFKFFDSKIKIIYVSHSIESEVRKKYSNKIIYFITKFLEKIVFEYSDLSTSVSIKEKKKLNSIYNVNPIFLPNGISIKIKNFKKIIKKNYIIFSGSYMYKPNKDAIDFLNNSIMPKLIKKIPNIKLVITGGGYEKKFPWLINIGIVSKKKLYQLIFFSKCLCVPLKFGSGTRVKILEALCLGAIVVSSKKGIEGIDLDKNNPPFIIDKEILLIRKLVELIKNNTQAKKKSIGSKNYYLEKYSMKNIIKKFIYDNKI